MDVSVTGGVSGVEVRVHNDMAGGAPPQRRRPGSGGRGLAGPREQVAAAGGTAKTHIANIQAKLGVANRVAVVSWAWRAGPALGHDE
ncbi:hypothetical protein ACIA5C_43635 [Actinoplanes sp. NPDC051343]|uniref:hypothetical protein n=1 Tax=Actinoplanes sp. NPDC051343 TaxID=3363906 RepID=UPI0037A411B7